MKIIKDIFNACLIVTVCFTACTKTIYLEKEKLVEVKEYITLTDTIFTPKVDSSKVVQNTEIKDTSRLETTHAMSEAFVANGQLHHSLWQKPNSFKFDIKMPTLHRDSVIRIREPYPVEVIKEVRVIPNIYKISLGIVIGEIIGAVGFAMLKFRKIL